MIIDTSYCQERYYGPRSNSRRGQTIDMLIMHTTESSSFQSTATTFMEQTDPPVSAHYVIDRDGRIYCFCPEETAANHAGKSSWRLVTGEEVTNINQRSIGIEFQCGPGEEITPEQTAAGLWLTKDIMSRNPYITPENVVGHSDIAPNRKSDPGMSFPWELWVQNGLASNATRRGNDGRSSQMSQEMMLACQRGYFNVNNYSFENTQYLTETDVQNFLARNKQQRGNNIQNSEKTDSTSLSSGIFEMILTACIGKIAGDNAITATLASVAMKSITNEPNTSDSSIKNVSVLDNINNVLG